MKRINLMHSIILKDMQRTYSELDEDHKKKVDTSILLRKLKEAIADTKADKGRVEYRRKVMQEIPSRLRRNEMGRKMPRRLSDGD